jgi:hypothetical protein
MQLLWINYLFEGLGDFPFFEYFSTINFKGEKSSNSIENSENKSILLDESSK